MLHKAKLATHLAISDPIAAARSLTRCREFSQSVVRVVKACCFISVGGILNERQSPTISACSVRLAS